MSERAGDISKRYNVGNVRKWRRRLEGSEKFWDNFFKSIGELREFQNCENCLLSHINIFYIFSLQIKKSSHLVIEFLRLFFCVYVWDFIYGLPR